MPQAVLHGVEDGKLIRVRLPEIANLIAITRPGTGAVTLVQRVGRVGVVVRETPEEILRGVGIDRLKIQPWVEEALRADHRWRWMFSGERCTEELTAVSQDAREHPEDWQARQAQRVQASDARRKEHREGGRRAGSACTDCPVYAGRACDRHCVEERELRGRHAA